MLLHIPITSEADTSWRDRKTLRQPKERATATMLLHIPITSEADTSWRDRKTLRQPKEPATATVLPHIPSYVPDGVADAEAVCWLSPVTSPTALLTAR